MDKYEPTCDGGCAVPNDEIPIDNAWHRYVLTLTTRQSSGTDHGDLRYEIDGVTVITDKVSFSLSNPKTYGFQLGVTCSSGKASGTVAFDDVSLQITPDPPPL